MITVSMEQMDRVQLILAGIPHGAERALGGAINRGITTARRAGQDAVVETYHISKKDFGGNNQMGITQATSANMIGSVRFAGHVIPLEKFQISKPRSSVGNVSAAVMRHSAPRTLLGNSEHSPAFVATMKSGHQGLWQRIRGSHAQGGKEKIRELYGPSVAKMAGKDTVVLQMYDAAGETVSTRLEHEITRLLNGYGR